MFTHTTRMSGLPCLKVRDDTDQNMMLVANARLFPLPKAQPAADITVPPAPEHRQNRWA